MSNWKPLQFIKYSSPHARARVHAVIVTVAVNVRGRQQDSQLDAQTSGAVSVVANLQSQLSVTDVAVACNT